MQDKIEPNNLTEADYQNYRNKCKGNINNLLMYIHNIDDGYRFHFLNKLFNWNNSKETLDVEFCSQTLKKAEDLEELVLCLPNKIRKRFIERISVGYKELLSKHDAERLSDAQSDKQVASHQHTPQTNNPIVPDTLPLHTPQTINPIFPDTLAFTAQTNANRPTNTYLTLRQLDAMRFNRYVETNEYYYHAYEMLSSLETYYRPLINEQSALQNSLEHQYNARSEYRTESLYWQPTFTTPVYQNPWNTPYNNIPHPPQNLCNSQSTDASFPQMLVRSSELGFFAPRGLIDSSSTLLEDYNALEQAANPTQEVTDPTDQFINNCFL